MLKINKKLNILLMKNINLIKHIYFESAWIKRVSKRKYYTEKANNIEFYNPVTHYLIIINE